MALEFARDLVDHRTNREHVEVNEPNTPTGAEVFIANIATADDGYAVVRDECYCCGGSFAAGAKTDSGF